MSFSRGSKTMRIRQKYDESKVIEAAHLFFSAQKKQREIAVLLGMTQPQVSEMIEQARDEGIIKIVINSSLDVKLARGIQGKYPHIKECIVLKYRGDKTKESNELVTDLLGKAAAEHFNGHVLTEGIVGVSGGMTLAEMANSLDNRGNTKNLSVYSMSIWCRSRIDAVSPVAIVSNIIEKYPGSRGYSAQLPDYSLDPVIAFQQKQMDLERIKPVLAGPSRKDKSKCLYVGLGSIPSGVENDSNALRERPIVDFANLLAELNISQKPLEIIAGECCLQPYDIKGHILHSQNCPDSELKEALRKIEDNIIGFELQSLREMVTAGTDIVCAVAGGFFKQRSVLGGLRSKIFNHLVTDITCAEHALADSDENA
jgi:DNA-binding transcriptional regulator LsrR (DeoR family)